MRVFSIKSNRGNSILEMLLFLPFALIFLFVATDLCLAYKDKFSIEAAIAHAVNEELKVRSDSPIFDYNQNAELIFNKEAAQEYLSQFNNSILQRILRTRNEVTLPDLKITSLLLRLEIDQETGRLKNNEILTVSYFNSSDKDEILSYVNEQLYKTNDLSTHRFTLPTSTICNLPHCYKYLPNTLIIALNVKTESAGLSKEITRALLANYFAIDFKFLTTLRKQIG